MNALLIARRLLREMVREPLLWGLTLAMPVFLFGLAVVGYSRAPLPHTWNVLVEPSVDHAHPGLAARLADARHLDGRMAFRLLSPRTTTADSPAPTLELHMAPSDEGSDALTFKGDALSPDYIAASNAVEAELEALAAARTGVSSWRLVPTLPPFRKPTSDFEAFAPGMMIFAVLLLVPQTAVLVSREVRRGTMQRLRLAGLGSSSYFGGILLSQSACAIALGVVLLAAAGLTGFPFAGSALVTATVVLGILLVLGLASIAQGLVLGAFLRSDGAATNWGSTVGMLQVLVSGAFFPMPSPTLVSVGQLGQPGFWSAGAYDILPATHAMRALQRAMSDGGRGTSRLFLAMLVLSMVYFFVACIVFERRTVRSD